MMIHFEQRNVDQGSGSNHNMVVTNKKKNNCKPAGVSMMRSSFWLLFVILMMMFVSPVLAEDCPTSPPTESPPAIFATAIFDPALITTDIAASQTTLTITLDNSAGSVDATLTFFTLNIAAGLTGLSATGSGQTNDCGSTTSGTRWRRRSRSSTTRWRPWAKPPRR